LIHTYAVSGRRTKVLKGLEELRKTSKWRYVPTMYFACIYAGLMDKDQAFFWLERAYQERSDGLTYLNVEPTFDPLRSRTCFAAWVFHPRKHFRLPWRPYRVAKKSVA
jgi:hypothetical protein